MSTPALKASRLDCRTEPPFFLYFSAKSSLKRSSFIFSKRHKKPKAAVVLASLFPAFADASENGRKIFSGWQAGPLGIVPSFSSATIMQPCGEKSKQVSAVFLSKATIKLAEVPAAAFLYGVISILERVCPPFMRDAKVRCV